MLEWETPIIKKGSLSYFLHIATNLWTDTYPLLSPPEAKNNGAFQ